MLLPVQNLPIPAYDAGNKHHANLAELSQLTHRRVAALVAERQALRRRINRNDVLRARAMQSILAGIDESVRAILPAFSKLEPGMRRSSDGRLSSFCSGCLAPGERAK